jgi:hypothetical protein
LKKPPSFQMGVAEPLSLQKKTIVSGGHLLLFEQFHEPADVIVEPGDHGDVSRAGFGLVGVVTAGIEVGPVFGDFAVELLHLLAGDQLEVGQGEREIAEEGGLLPGVLPDETFGGGSRDIAGVGGVGIGGAAGSFFDVFAVEEVAGVVEVCVDLVQDAVEGVEALAGGDARRSLSPRPTCRSSRPCSPRIAAPRRR